MQEHVLWYHSLVALTRYTDQIYIFEKLYKRTMLNVSKTTPRSI